MKIYTTKLKGLDTNVVLFNINKMEDVLYSHVIGFYDDIKVPENIKLRFKLALEELSNNQKTQSNQINNLEKS